MAEKVFVLDKGYVTLLNVSGPIRRESSISEKQVNYDARDTDPAKVARMSFSNFNKDRSEQQDIRLVNYLIKNKHTTPIEMIETWWEIKAPIFVARQWFRHRTASANEESLRYIKSDCEFWVPKPEDVGHRPTSMKQGREIDGKVDNNVINWIKNIEDLDKKTKLIYEQAIKDGIPPEVARSRLPLATYTKFVWHQDLHNLMHFLKLRMDKHAQYEIQQYANTMFSLLEKELPYIMGTMKE